MRIGAVLRFPEDVLKNSVRQTLQDLIAGEISAQNYWLWKFSNIYWYAVCPSILETVSVSNMDNLCIS